MFVRWAISVVRQLDFERIGVGGCLYPCIIGIFLIKLDYVHTTIASESFVHCRRNALHFLFGKAIFASCKVFNFAIYHLPFRNSCR